jgi:hypothetical protein
MTDNETGGNVKVRPILVGMQTVDEIVDGKKTVFMQLVRDAVVISADDARGATDKPCPYGEPGDRLSLHVLGFATNIRLEIVRTRLANLTYEITDADAVANGYESKSHMIAKDPVGAFGEADHVWVWVCEFKLVGAPE